MSKKEDIEKKKKKDEEELNKIIEELKKIDGVKVDDIDKIGNILHTALIDVKYSKMRKFLFMIRPTIVKFILFYIISLLFFGFFFSFVALTEKYHIFIVCGVISFILTMFELVPYFGKIRHSFLYLSMFALMIMDLCLFNNFFPIFTNSYIWIFFILGGETLYIMFVNTAARISIG